MKMKTENRKNKQTRAPLDGFAFMESVKILTTFCLLIYAVVPPFIFCNCSGRCFAGVRIPSSIPAQTVADAPSAAFLPREIESGKRACCENRHARVRRTTCRVQRRDFVVDPCCCKQSQDSSCPVKKDDSGKNCCDHFFKSSAKTSDSVSVALTSIIKASCAVACVDDWEYASIGTFWRSRRSIPNRAPSALRLHLLFHVMLN